MGDLANTFKAAVTIGVPFSGGPSYEVSGLGGTALSVTSAPASEPPGIHLGKP
ncbi:MAG: hypothetical protein IT558_04385 [Alphaproteobacteria bacterium]|nr:hypothetical protein [Alphaproteobacteria bacterium]